MLLWLTGECRCFAVLSHLKGYIENIKTLHMGTVTRAHVTFRRASGGLLHFSGLLTVLGILGLPSSRRHAERRRIPDSQFGEHSADTQQAHAACEVEGKHASETDSAMSPTSPTRFPGATTGDKPKLIFSLFVSSNEIYHTSRNELVPHCTGNRSNKYRFHFFTVSKVMFAGLKG